MKKYLIYPQLMRRIPQHFSWIDHRLIRDRYVERCYLEAIALYLVLVTVADAQGLSYYSDRSLCKLLRIEQGILEKSRRNLIQEALIAYEPPLYQILSLERQIPEKSPTNEKPSSSPSKTREPQYCPTDPLFIGKIIEDMKRKWCHD